MRQRSFLFLVVFGLLFSGEIFGQYLYNAKKAPNKYQGLLQTDFGCTVRLKKQDAGNSNGEKQTLQSTPSLRVRPSISFAGSVITSSCYTDNLGFFCKKELQIQKLTSLPVYFRLGTLEYVNYLEQKPNAVKPR